MFSQSFVLFVRNLLKDKVFTCINVANLVIGFATFILITQFINAELHYDIQNVNYDRIYRVQLFMDEPDNAVKHTWSNTAAIARHNLVNLPEIDKIVLIHDVGDNNKNGVFLSPDKQNQFLTRFGYYADQTLFDVFTFDFVEGNMHEALTQPYSIVLSQRTANRIFPGEKALGKQVYGENKVAFTVTGVYRDLPENCDWRPEYLLPMLSFTATTGWKNYEENYWGYSFCIYVMLKNGAKASSVDAKIHDALKQYRKEHYPYLRPLSKLHVNPYFESSMINGYSLLSFIALLILILSTTNYVNLQTANAGTRLREIGIKKAVGFSRKQLWIQFVVESVIMALMTGIAGLLLAHFSVPLFNQVMGKNMVNSVFYHPGLVILILGVTLLTGFLSGIYPSYIISSFNPVYALKQRYMAEERNGISLKKVLVTLQFAISIFLLIVSFIVYRQTMYMANRDMGFESKNLLFANIVSNNKGSFEQLRQKLIKHPEIADACMSDYIPFILPGGDDLTWEGAENDEKVFVRISNVTYDFVPTYKLKIVLGRNFSREYPSDGNKCLINETAARMFRWDQPIGKHIKGGYFNNNIEVIGVIKDYIPFSVHNPIEPHMYRLIPDSAGLHGVHSVRFVPGYEKKARAILDEEFKTAMPDDAFEFRNIQYLIQHENALKIWTVFKKMCIFFAVISIIISSIGLFGLVLFFARRKMKEIGMRKVLGFSTFNLYFHMASGFIALLFLSLIIAWPGAYYVYKFLPGAHKYGIQIWEFLLATGILVIVALVTMTYQIIKAARTRPAEVLKEE
jgi:putative ABC transport system permease protein